MVYTTQVFTFSMACKYNSIQPNARSCRQQGSQVNQFSTEFLNRVLDNRTICNIFANNETRINNQLTLILTERDLLLILCLAWYALKVNYNNQTLITKIQIIQKVCLTKDLIVNVLSKYWFLCLHQKAIKTIKISRILSIGSQILKGYERIFRHWNLVTLKLHWILPTLHDFIYWNLITLYIKTLASQ